MDAYDIMFGQLEPEELKKVNRSRNYGQAINLPAKEVYEGFDIVEQEMGTRKSQAAAKGHDPFVNFNPDAPDGQDPFTGATARDYAELLYPAAKAATKGTAESLMSGAYIAAGHMGSQMLDVLKYIGSKGAPQGVISTALPDMEGTDVFPIAKRMFENTVKRGEEFKKWSQEDGVGPIAQFIAETAGSAPAGIAEFMLNMPFYGAKGGMKAEQKGDNEFIGFLKGALERNLMGRVLHSAAALSRPMRMGVTGAVFEEQARLGEGVSDPEKLMEAFLTGGIFGTMGGKGKISTHDLRKELGNLEMEARERVRILGEMAPGDIMPGERGSATGNYLGGEPELTMTRAIRVGKKTYPVEEGSDHGKTYENIPTSELVKAGTDLQTGWMDQKGKFYTRQEVPWEKTTNMRDLTEGETKKMDQGRAGDEISTDLLKGNTPKFKNSEEAVFFGGKATPEQVTQLKAALEKGYADTAARKDAAFEAMKAGDFGPTNQLMKDSLQNQFMREAIETAEGAPRHGGGGAGEGGKPPGGGEGPPKQYTKGLYAIKGKDLLNDVFDVQVGVEGETGKPVIKQKHLWEMSKAEVDRVLDSSTPHEEAVFRALREGRDVPREALREYIGEGDLNAAEGISGIFAMKEHEMEVWLGQKSDAAIIYNYTNKMLTKTQKADIKRQVREVTGQANASEILSFPESTLLKNQIIMEVKASREAMNKGLKEGAAVASGRLHLAIEMARARADAKAEIGYMIKEIKTVDPKKMTANTSDEVTRILAGLDLQKMSAAKRAKLERTQDYVTRGGEAELDYEVDSFVGLDTRVSVDKTLDYLSKSENTELPDYVLDDLARLNKTPIRDLSYQEIQSIHKSVMSLAAQSDRIQNLVVKLRDMKAEEASKQAVKEMKDPDGVVRDIISTRPTMMDKFKGLGHWIKVNLGLRQDSYDLIVETIAGPNGVAHDVLYKNPKRGILVQKQSQQKAESAFRDSLQKDGFHKAVKNPDKWMDERVRVGKWELSRGERMSLYMHSLNADNRRAILESGVGFKNPPPSSGLTPNKVVRITEKELDAISDSLTPEERMMTKAATAMFKEQGVDLANEFYRLNRYRMPPQDNYYPKDTMPLRRGGLDLETEEGMEAFRQFTARVGIDKTMLIERVGSTKPIYLNDLMTDVNRSVRKATAYIGLEDSMRNASRLLYDSNFKREMVDRYGRDTWIELEKGLKDIAGSYKSWTSFEKGVTKLKTTTVSSALSINPWVWLNQPFSLINYWSYIEPRYLTKGLVDSIAHPKDSLDGLRMYSAELVDRLKSGYDRDVAAVYAAERDKSFYKGKSTLQEKGITPTKYFDLTAVVPGMKAAVYKALDEFKTGKLSRPVEQALNVTGEEAMNWTPEQKVAKAHEFADWVTQRTQAQSTMEHRSPLSRGTTLEQMFTAFTSQTNVMLGLARRTYRDYQRTKDPEAFRSMAKAWTSVFILNAGFMMGIDRLRDLVYGRDSKSLVAGFIDNAASLLYFVRDIEKTASSFIQEGHRGRESTIPATRFMEVIKDVATHINGLYSENEQVVEESYLGIVDGMAQMGAIYTGLPYQTPKRLLQAATGNNPPPKEGKEEDSSFFDGLMED